MHKGFILQVISYDMDSNDSYKLKIKRRSKDTRKV